MSREWEANARQVGRWLRLAKPIAAVLDGAPLLLLDLSRSSALLTGPVDFEVGATHELSFLHDGHAVRVLSLVTASAEHGVSSDRDILVRFTELESGLDAFIGAYEEQIRRAELANLEGRIEQNVIDDDRMLSDLGEAARGNEPFVRCTFIEGRWTREVTFDREQPAAGFTVSAAEADDQIRLLQLAFEETDDDGRAAMREFAALSLPGTH